MGSGRTVLNNASPYERAGIISNFYSMFLCEIQVTYHGNQFSETLQKIRKPSARAQSNSKHKPNPYEKLWPLSRKWQVQGGALVASADAKLLLQRAFFFSSFFLLAIEKERRTFPDKHPGGMFVNINLKISTKLIPLVTYAYFLQSVK